MKKTEIGESACPLPEIDVTVCTIRRLLRSASSILLFGTLLLASCGSDDAQRFAASDTLVQTSLGPVEGGKYGYGH